MDGFLKQSTAVTLKVGPFVDETDGFTAMTALTISQADVRLSKNGGNMAQKNETTALTHDEIGMYDCPLDATDTNTLGALSVNVHESGALPVKQTYMIVTANVWDSLFGADLLQVDATQLLGTAFATPSVAGVPEVDVVAVEGGDATDALLAAVNAALGATLADSIPADGTRPSIAQAIYMLVQFMLEREVAGVTMTVKKVDGATPLFTLTLDDATTPSAVTRAT